MKVKHFAAKTIDINVSLDIEMIVIELFIAFLCGVFAYMGYKAQILLLLVLNLGASTLCLFAALSSIYSYFRERRELKKKERGCETQ